MINVWRVYHLRRIPVIIISGFLGSGKTTLLLRLLQEIQSRQLQPGILMNELGKKDVDGFIVDELGGASLEKLLDGCVCCSKKSELILSLKLLLDRKPDVILIELTGVANPEEIADAITEPGLIRQVALKQIVTVLDAENALDYNSIFSSDKQLVQTLRRQLEVADHIIVNKTDLVQAPHLQKIQKVILKQNERALITFASHSLMDLTPILLGITRNSDITPIAIQRFRSFKTEPLNQVQSTPKLKENQDHKEYRSFTRVQTLTLTIQSPTSVTQEDVEHFLQRWKKQLLRAKGYLHLSNSNKTFLMQHAGKRTYWETSTYSGAAYFVIIGIELDIDRVLTEWSALQKEKTTA
ncbi:hypothetical protein PMSM_04640 [Paenibacillus macquariensis subsp. macquariensis]|nr:hypothetical protein PMSM_04640 [Paenibacillus macquariensis subsp. macquariensis]